MMNKKTSIVAIALVLVLMLWLLSGHLMREPDDGAAPVPELRDETFLVEARWSQAQPVLRRLRLQGDTAANRRVTLRAETAGPVAEVLAQRGETVEADQPLLRLSEAGRASRLRQARAQVAQAETAFEAARELAAEGFQSEIQVRQARASLEAAQAELAAAQEAMRQTVVRAPFAGILDQRGVERGDYLSPGSELGILVDLQPLLIRVDVPQREVSRISLDSDTRARPIGADWTPGRIRFIASSADTRTRTFTVEVEVPNPQSRLPAGMSAEVEIALEQVSAHFLSPGLLSLDADGVLGIKTVDEDGRVRFHDVKLVRSELDGVWLTGLPERARVITVGQGFVAPGQQVRVHMAEDER